MEEIKKLIIEICVRLGDDSESDEEIGPDMEEYLLIDNNQLFYSFDWIRNDEFFRGLYVISAILSLNSKWSDTTLGHERKPWALEVYSVKGVEKELQDFISYLDTHGTD